MQFDAAALIGVVFVIVGFTWFFGSLAAAIGARGRGTLPSAGEARGRLAASAVIFGGAALIVATRPIDTAIVAAIPLLVLAGLALALALAIPPRGPM